MKIVVVEKVEMSDFGRYYITKVIEMAKKEGFEVIYADTDSCFVKIGG